MSGPAGKRAGAGGFFRQAQIFTASRSGSLRQIKLNVKKAAGSAGDYSAQLLRVVSDASSASPRRQERWAQAAEPRRGGLDGRPR